MANDLAEATRSQPTVSGRDLTLRLVSEINTAIRDYEENHKSPLARDLDGKVSQPLIMELDDGFYIVRPSE